MNIKHAKPRYPRKLREAFVRNHPFRIRDLNFDNREWDLLLTGNHFYVRPKVVGVDLASGPDRSILAIVGTLNRFESYPLRVLHAQPISFSELLATPLPTFIRREDIEAMWKRLEPRP